MKKSRELSKVLLYKKNDRLLLVKQAVVFISICFTEILVQGLFSKIDHISETAMLRLHETGMIQNDRFELQ